MLPPKTPFLSDRRFLASQVTKSYGKLSYDLGRFGLDSFVLGSALGLLRDARLLTRLDWNESKHRR